jgi:hypothetical protein
MISLFPAGSYLGFVTSTGNLLTLTEMSGPDHITTTQMPLNQWVCLELTVDQTGGGNGHVRAYVNSVLLLDFVPAMPSANIGSVRVGLPRAGGDVDTHVYVDDFALAPGPIGCPE